VLSRIAVVALALLPTVAHAEDPWKSYSVKDGVTYERRAVSGSRFYEYRASTSVAAAPAAVLDAIWSGITEALPPTVKKRTVLQRSTTDFVVYDQIKTPVVSDRDAVLHIRKVIRGDGTIEVRFETDNRVGPPPDPKYVRLPVVRGAWTIEPAPLGSRLTYTCYSEPGGSIPAFLARGAQQDQVPLDVGRILGFISRRK
jgi:hypothetical protein